MAGEPFAVWLTGLPACGKSTIARQLLESLHARAIDPALLESDVLRTQITPFARYDEAERDFFYAVLAYLGALLIENHKAVVFDATANRRAYRDIARRAIPRFAEVLVDTPAAVCEARDPKGLYRAARQGRSQHLPGAQAAYEAPLAPEIVVQGTQPPAQCAQAIVAWLERQGWIRAVPGTA